MTRRAGVSPRVKAQAGKSWDKVRSAAEQLERIQPGAGSALLLGAAGALEAYLQQALLSPAPGQPRLSALSAPSGRRAAS